MPVDDYQHADYKDTDDRGRITLGQEHANSTVTVAWTELDLPDRNDAVVTPSQEERDKLTELHQWAEVNGHTVLDFDPHRGRIYTKDAEWVNADVEGLQK